MPIDTSHEMTIKIQNEAKDKIRRQRIAMQDDWLRCDITLSWMDVSKHKPHSNCKVFVAMQDGEIRPAYYETDYGFSDGREDGGFLEPEYWTHSIMSPQDWLEDNKLQQSIKEPS